MEQGLAPLERCLEVTDTIRRRRHHDDTLHLGVSVERFDQSRRDRPRRTRNGDALHGPTMPYMTERSEVQQATLGPAEPDLTVGIGSASEMMDQ
jgi:hypothetical protein